MIKNALSKIFVTGFVSALKNEEIKTVLMGYLMAETKFMTKLTVRLSIKYKLINL